MKKAQILSVIALAFALGLGVVVPVANTFAQITPNTATKEQKEAIYEEAEELLEVLGDIENVDAYKALYADTEAFVKALDKIAASQLRLFNENMAHGKENVDSTNYYIAQAATYLGTGVGKLYHSTTISGEKVYDYIKPGVDFADAELQTIPVFTKVNTLKEAYDAAIAVRDAAASNITTLKNNYKWDGSTSTQPYDKAIINYAAIESNVNDWLKYVGLAFQGGTYYDFDVNSNNLADHYLLAGYPTNTPGGSAITPSQLANEIKEISTPAYNALIANKDWTATPTTGVELATNYGLVIKAAKALPSYEFTKGLIDAETNVRKILSPENAGDRTVNVDYSKAQAYISALKVAIADFKAGKSTANDGSNKPGDGTGDGDVNAVAPDTGIVANTEAGATTTVAMVAGLATALTAAGAGVVAYRNARRSTRK